MRRNVLASAVYSNSFLLGGVLASRPRLLGGFCELASSSTAEELFPTLEWYLVDSV
jgi:hypothetical protein